MAKKIVTLYMDNNSLRLMETRGKRVKKLADVPLDFTQAKANPSLKDTELAAKLKQLIKTKRVRRKDVVVGISGMHCLSRPVVLPMLPKAILEEAVMREAKRVLPMPLEQLYVSWQTIPCAEKDKVGVFLVGIPCRIADDLFKMLAQVGLKPSVLDIKPIALARVVNDPTAIIVDIQPGEFDLVIMVDGVPQPIRTMPFPSEGLSEQEKLMMVRNELERTIQFYNTNYPEKPLSATATIYVSGELIDKPELYQALGNEMGHPVQPLTSPLKSPKQPVPSQFLVNVGLTLKELEEPRPLVTNLNTMPVPYRPRSISLSKLAAVPGTAIVLGLLAMMVMNIQTASGSISSVQSKLDSTNSVIQFRQTQKTKLTKSIADLEKNIKSTLGARDAFAVALTSLQKQAALINGDLNTSVKVVPPDVTVSQINHTKDRMTLNGIALSEAEVLTYARNLAQTGRFLEVIITSLNRIIEEESDNTTAENPAEEGGGTDNITDNVTDNMTSGSGQQGASDLMEFIITLKKAGK